MGERQPSLSRGALTGFGSLTRQLELDGSDRPSTSIEAHLEVLGIGCAGRFGGSSGEHRGGGTATIEANPSRRLPNGGYLSNSSKCWRALPSLAKHRRSMRSSARAAHSVFWWCW